MFTDCYFRTFSFCPQIHQSYIPLLRTPLPLDWPMSTLSTSRSSSYIHITHAMQVGNNDTCVFAFSRVSQFAFWVFSDQNTTQPKPSKGFKDCNKRLLSVYLLPTQTRPWVDKLTSSAGVAKECFPRLPVRLCMVWWDICHLANKIHQSQRETHNHCTNFGTQKKCACSWSRTLPIGSESTCLMWPASASVNSHGTKQRVSWGLHNMGLGEACMHLRMNSQKKKIQNRENA